MSRYINADSLLTDELTHTLPSGCGRASGRTVVFVEDIEKQPTADVVKVVRCRDCKHFQPCFVLTNDGERRPYTEEEIRKGKMVAGDVGINCGSRCERFGYWDENKIPVWFSENDFCSYGERRTE